MKFCSECDTMYEVDRSNRRYVCPKCGHEEPLEENMTIQRSRKDEDKIIVIGRKEQKLQTLPTTKAKCPKCDNGQAYWWMVQTRGIDESSTQFYRCTKCRHTWRDYG